MAHAIWSGSVNFGLVMIPVKLFTAVREKGLHFHLLHEKDEGRINNVRRCSVCGQEVKWDELVRGFEFEKNHYVTLTDADLKKANVEATQSVDILEFVDLSEINPMLFDQPYYLAPEKKGRHAYALLRDALKESGKVGIARVVLRSREHLAAVKPQGDALVLELMHFADEIVDTAGLDIPTAEKPRPPEMKAAKMLIDTMASKFDPKSFRDKYTDELLALIEARAHNQPIPKGKAKALPPSNVVDLMGILQKSLQQTSKRRAEKPGVAKPKPAAKAAPPKRRRAS